MAGDSLFGSDRRRLKGLFALGLDGSDGQDIDITTPPKAHTPPGEAPGKTIGRYKLLEKVGEGGCGVVYVAEQKEPVKRRVALKIIKAGMDTKQVIARFEAERQALAVMDHPNIAKVFDAGATEAGRPFFVMELVRGIPITDYCDREKLSTKKRLDLFIQVCHAIQHAHQKGIIHRDIKPSNIMVTVRDRVPIPKVIDFGIAKAIQQDLTDKTVYTRLQQLVGTPPYISPEQAEMSGLDVDTQSDIYSLGVLLYELLTGRTPFDMEALVQGGIDAMCKTIRETEPPKPSTKVATLAPEDGSITAARQGMEVPKLISLLRGDLDWIVMKCLEKDRTRRYETASGLAMDLERHLNNEPVVARPPSAIYRFQKAWRRNRVIYAAGFLVMLSLLAGIATSTWQAVRATYAKRDAVTARQQAKDNEQKALQARAREAKLREQAQAQELVARRRAYASDMNIAKHALDDNNLGHALDMLEQQVPKQGETDLRGWEWRYLWGQTRSDSLFTLCRESSEIHSLSVSSNGSLLVATVYGRGGLSLWNIPDRREVLHLAQSEQNVCAVISPTEPLLAFSGINFEPSGEQRSSLWLWNLDTRQEITEKPLDGECVHLAISTDGGTLATVTVGNRTTYQFGGHIASWRLPEGTELWSYPLPAPPAGFAVTPDLGLAAVSVQGIHVVELKAKHELWSMGGYARALAFSPDGKLLAGGGDEKDILLWDATTGQEIGRLVGHRSWVNSLAFWPDGKKLASGSADQTIRIWDVPNRKCVNTLRGHRQQVWQLALIPDSQTLVSGCRDGSVCLWDASIDCPRRPRIEIPDSTLAWAFEADSKSVLTLNGHGRVTRWKGSNFQLPEPLLETGEIRDQGGFKWCFSRDGRRLALGSTDGRVQVWDISRRTLWRQLMNPTGLVRAIGFFADGNRLLTFSVNDKIVHDWDLTTASEIQSWRAPADRVHFALSPDERSCLTMGYDTGDLELRNLADRSTTRLNLDIRESHDGDYSPDGRLVAVPSSLGFVRIFDSTSWTEEKTLRGFFDEVWGAAFLSDGRRLAVIAADREAVRLYDTATWQDTLTLEGEGGGLWPTMISPDGNVIGAKTLGDGRLHLWRAPSWEEINITEAREKQLGTRH